jgi:hypothetical protein
MELRNFPNPKLNLPKEFTKINNGGLECFKYLEEYLHRVKPYIFTEINLDYQKSDTKHRHAWVQRFVSANLLRSLYLRNSVIEAFNTRNIIALYTLLKSWFEILGVFAYILELLERNSKEKDLDELWARFLLGNKGEGNLRVGEIEGINVFRLMESANKYMTKMRKRSKQELTNEGLDTFITDLYDVVNNNSHPAFDANDMVEFIDEKGVWFGKEPDDIKKAIFTELHGYSGILGLTVILIPHICAEIFKLEKEHFFLLNSNHYFD